MTEGIQNALNSAGPQADNIAGLWWLMFVVCSIVFVLVMIALLLAIKNRTREPQFDSTPLLEPQPEQERRRRNVVVTCVAITAIVLFVFLIASFSAGRSMSAQTASKTGLTIDVTGFQWWWEIRYQDVDASNIFTTANEIHIPVGVPVTLNLRANDVIHSFWVPNLAGKKDLIPGKANTLWIQGSARSIAACSMRTWHSGLSQSRRSNSTRGARIKHKLQLHQRLIHRSADSRCFCRPRV
jgi:cytochrome c oxidase subunit 2